MPPEMWTTISNWGFPALLVLYGVWVFDGKILPALLAHLKSVSEMTDAVKINSATLTAVAVDTHDAKKASERTEAKVGELHTAINQGLTHRIINTTDAVDKRS